MALNKTLRHSPRPGAKVLQGVGALQPALQWQLGVRVACKHCALLFRKLFTWTSRPPSLSLRATTSTWLFPRNTRKLWGPRRDTFTVYFMPAEQELTSLVCELQPSLHSMEMSTDNL